MKSGFWKTGVAVIVILLTSAGFSSGAGDIIWQIGVPDNSGKEFMYLYTQDFGGSTAITGLPGFDRKTYTLTYTVNPENVVDKTPEFPSALANPYALGYTDRQPVFLRICWTEKEAGMRCFEIHTTRYVNVEKYAGDNYLIQLPGNHQAYFQVPCTTADLGANRLDVEKDLSFAVVFPVAAGRNEIVINSQIYSARSEIQFDYLNLTAVTVPAELKPTLEAFTDKFSNIFTPGQGIDFIVKAYNLAPEQNYSLMYKIFDLWDKPVRSGKISFKSGPDGTAQIPVKESLNDRGYFELRSELVDGTRQPVKLGMARDFCGLSFSVIEPAPIEFIENSRFGASIDCYALYGYNPGYIETQYTRFASLARMVGIKWIRFFGFSWNVIEPAKGQYRWDEYDTLINIHRQNGLHTLGLFMNTPDWADSLPERKSRFNGIYDPPKQDDWERFVEVLAARYKDKIHRWEIWNEPDWFPSGFWAGDPALFTETCRTATRALKKVNPDNVAVSSWCGVGYPPPEDKFMDRALSVYQKGDFDAYAYHYPWPEHRLATKLMMEKYGIYNMPAYDTETYWHPRGDEDKDVSADTIKGYVEDAAWGIVQTHFFTVRSYGTSKWGKASDSGQKGLVNWDFSLNPLGVAYRTMTKHLENTGYAGKIETCENITAHVFNRAGNYILVIWTSDGKEQEFTLPGGSADTRVHNMMDNPEQLPVNGTSVKVKADYYPVFIEGLDKKVVDVMLKVRFSTARTGLVAGEKFTVELDVAKVPVTGWVKFLVPSGWSSTELKPIRVEKDKDLKLNLKLTVPQNAGHKQYDIMAELVPDGMKDVFISSRLSLITLLGNPGENLLSDNGMIKEENWNARGNVTFLEEGKEGISGFNGKGKLSYTGKVSVIPGEKYIVGFWAKGTAQPALSMKQYNEDGYPISLARNILKAGPSDDFKLFRTIYQVPPHIGNIAPAITVKEGAGQIKEAVVIQPRTEAEANYYKIKFLAYSPRAKKTVVIDGNLDDWNLSRPTCLDNQENVRRITDWKEVDDLSAVFYTMWDDDNFYLSVRVKDDKYVQDSLAPGESDPGWWKEDSVQFGLDPDDQAKAEEFLELGAYKSADKGPVLLRYHTVKTTNILPQMYPGIVKEAQVVIKTEGDCTVYEMAIPLSSLWPMRAFPNKRFGFSLLVNDNDGQGRRGWMEWGSGIGMSKDPSQYGEIICVE